MSFTAKGYMHYVRRLKPFAALLCMAGREAKSASRYVGEDRFVSQNAKQGSCDPREQEECRPYHITNARGEPGVHLFDRQGVGDDHPYLAALVEFDPPGALASRERAPIANDRSDVQLDRLVGQPAS
jgi:hypothetical protein